MTLFFLFFSGFTMVFFSSLLLLELLDAQGGGLVRLSGHRPSRAVFLVLQDCREGVHVGGLAFGDGRLAVLLMAVARHLDPVDFSTLAVRAFESSSPS